MKEKFAKALEKLPEGWGRSVVRGKEIITAPTKGRKIGPEGDYNVDLGGEITQEMEQRGAERERDIGQDNERPRDEDVVQHIDMDDIDIEVGDDDEEYGGEKEKRRLMGNMSAMMFGQALSKRNK